MDDSMMTRSDVTDWLESRRGQTLCVTLLLRLKEGSIAL
jgi:hypothetical protein